MPSKSNRFSRRSQEKGIKAKLSDSQFKALVSESNTQFLASELNGYKHKISEAIAEVLYNTLRENKISKERTEKIMQNFTDKLDTTHNEMHMEIVKKDNLPPDMKEEKKTEPFLPFSIEKRNEIIKNRPGTQRIIAVEP